MSAPVQTAPSAGAPRAETPVLQRRMRWVLGLALLFAGLWTVRSFLPALGWAAILAIATWPLYRRATRRYPEGGRLLWPAAFTAGVALLVLLPLAMAAVQVAHEARVVAGLVEEARRSGLPVPEWLPGLPLAGPPAAAWWRENLTDSAAAAGMIGRLGQLPLAGWSRSLGGQLVHRALVFGFTLLTLFFLYRDGRWLADRLLALGQQVVGPHGERVGRQIVASVHGTVDGLVLVGLGEGLLLGLAYWTAGVPHPALFGAATAVAAMIPFAAPLLFGAAALLVLVKGSTTAAIAIVVWGSLVVFVADHAVRPALIGGATQLPFLWVLFGILGGVETFGLLGLFLGPALMAALHLLWREWTTPAEGLPGPAAEVL